MHIANSNNIIEQKSTIVLRTDTSVLLHIVFPMIEFSITITGTHPEGCHRTGADRPESFPSMCTQQDQV